ncbi:MAG: hypothetical protein B6D61_00565 [Bacteroidetes bacterium 4484_249]|nr:MAG: hypothetical protein B6D61_00565 [Bacteroidetes bacterium 4484_249]HGY11631.1 hypothetical protein [Desulfobacterales bacterium]
MKEMWPCLVLQVIKPIKSFYMKDLIIIGAGSVGSHIAHNLDEYLTGYRLLGFLDDDPDKIDLNLFGYPVIGNIDTFFSKDFKNVEVIIGIAFPNTKKKIIEKLTSKKAFISPSLVSKNAWLSKRVAVGNGAIIYPGVSINFGTHIDEFVVINMNCAIGHDCHIGKYTSLAPGVNLAGHTYIGNSVDMGIGSATIQNIKISSNSVVGGNSIVIHNVDEPTTVVGVPAKK